MSEKNNLPTGWGSPGEDMEEVEVPSWSDDSQTDEDAGSLENPELTNAYTPSSSATPNIIIAVAGIVIALGIAFFGGMLVFNMLGNGKGDKVVDSDGSNRTSAETKSVETESVETEPAVVEPEEESTEDAMSEGLSQDNTAFDQWIQEELFKVDNAVVKYDGNREKFETYGMDFSKDATIEFLTILNSAEGLLKAIDKDSLSQDRQSEYKVQLSKLQRSIQSIELDLESLEEKGINNNNEYAEYSDDYILPNSSFKLLKEKQVKKLSKEECRLAKNEIYARHGRMFLDEDLQNYFNQKSWYVGTIKPKDFRESYLSSIEKRNVQLLVKYENK